MYACRTGLRASEGLHITSAVYVAGRAALSSPRADAEMLSSHESLIALLRSQEYDHVIALQDHAGISQLLCLHAICPFYSLTEKP